MIPLWTIGAFWRVGMFFFKRHKEKKFRRHLEEVAASLPQGGPMDLLLHLITLGPLKGYRSLIGILLYLYSTLGAAHGWPGAGHDLQALAESIFGLGVVGKLAPGGDVTKPAA